MPGKRHVFTPQQRQRGGLLSPTQFRRGFDPRRHVFTRAECVAGGQRSWDLFMVRYRVGAGLPIPIHLADLVEHALGVPGRGRNRKED